MVIVALVSFAILFAGWLVAPSPEPHPTPTEVTPAARFVAEAEAAPQAA
ncbi:MAG: hypothetical protein M3Y88_03000 [Chloroflexota bacterium]|nr:hypothetical protein [Chloroflexota bacterium]